MINISIIIPVYKVEKYISECLQSVFEQTYQEGIECILVDDCGGDKSIDIARSMINEYKGRIKFTILTHNKNMGLSAARNTAIKQASGQYLFFLDSDDTIIPSCMEVFWKIVEKYPGVDLVQGNLYRENMDPSQTPYKQSEYIRKASRIRYNMSRFRITDAGCNRLIRKDYLIMNNLYFKEGYLQEDTIWAFDIQRTIKTFADCNKYTYYYRTTPNSIMTSLTNEKEAKDFSIVYNVCLDKVKDSALHPYDILYLSMLAARVKRADSLLCRKLIPSMESPLFSRLTDAMIMRTSSNVSKIHKLYAEILVQILYRLVYYTKSI